MGFYLLAILIILFYGAITILWPRSSDTRRGRPMKLPSGPKQLPILGNLHQISMDHQERTFARWAREYGDLVYAKFFTRPVLIINSQRIARELLDKRGVKYSSRPRLVMMCEVLGLHRNPVMMPYDDEHRRKQRRWIEQMFGDKGMAQQFEDLQRREACVLVYGLMRTPNEFALHVKRYVSALIMESVYGHRISSLEDDFILLVDHVMEEIAATGPAGGTLVDFLPILKYIPAWMPCMAWKRRALRARDAAVEGRTKPYVTAREKVLSGTSPRSYVSVLIGEAIKEGILPQTEEDIRESSSALYGAGTDTAKTAILTFILAMLLHPNVYLRAQSEIDHIVGQDRLPTLADREALTYIDCVIKEVYRWNPPVPLGIPHYLTEDDKYEDFDLPKNTAVIANLWSMARSKDVYGDPESFRPERFMIPNGISSEISDPRNIVFGHGRRLCPGRRFGDAAVFLAVSSMIATLDIHKARDNQGKEITPEPRFMSGFVSHPLDFVCSITPRTPKVVELVAEILISMS